MIIGVMTLQLEIPEAMSLKDKRAVLNKIRDRTRNKFNVSIAEVEDQDVWNAATLGVAVVTNEQRYANQVLQQVLNLVESQHLCIVESADMEYLREE